MLCWNAFFIKHTYIIVSWAFQVVWMNFVVFYSNVARLMITVHISWKLQCFQVRLQTALFWSLMEWKCGDCRSLKPWKLTMFLEPSSENACFVTWCIIMLEVLSQVWINCSHRVMHLVRTSLSIRKYLPFYTQSLSHHCHDHQTEMLHIACTKL